MGKKTIDQIWKEMQEKRDSEKQSKLIQEQSIWQQREDARQEYLKRNRMYESLSNNTTTSSSAAGGTQYEDYISQIDTIWLYPQADIDSYLSTLILSGNNYQTAPGLSPSLSFTKVDNVYSFPNLNKLVLFYSFVYLQTEITQPIGNLGYSLGVGTVTRSRKSDRLILKLDSGIKVVEWALMRQITNQSDLPVGGNSPDGTIGWGSIYCDWDLDGVQDATNIAAPISNLIDGIIFKKII